MLSNSHIIQFMIYGALGFSMLLVAIVYMLIAQNKRRYLYLAEKKEMEYQYQNELLNTKIELQEHLLNQVSQEIHDNVGQVLSLVKVHLYSVSNQPANQRSVELLNTSATLLDKAIEDLRNISHAQSATILQRLGLKETIGKELDYLRALKKQTCELEVTGNYYSLLPEQELFIYRVAQEAINNSIKHANCTLLKVTMSYTPEMFTLTVSDNGAGFDTMSVTSNPGIGIAHMQQRAKLLQAELDIQSQQQKGTVVTLQMPVKS